MSPPERYNTNIPETLNASHRKPSRPVRRNVVHDHKPSPVHPPQTSPYSLPSAPNQMMLST